LPQVDASIYFKNHTGFMDALRNWQKCYRFSEDPHSHGVVGHHLGLLSNCSACAHVPGSCPPTLVSFAHHPSAGASAEAPPDHGDPPASSTLPDTPVPSAPAAPPARGLAKFPLVPRDQRAPLLMITGDLVVQGCCMHGPSGATLCSPHSLVQHTTTLQSDRLRHPSLSTCYCPSH
jgi:hypothetical protein